jgi:hypothetical protein
MSAQSHRLPRTVSGNAAARWFSALMWIGIVANIIVAVTSIVWTEAVLDFFNLDMAQSRIWPRFAAFLLILLTIFYVPAALDPIVHRYAAVVSVICRFAGVAFFSIVGGRYIVFGLYDLIFALPQAILLWLARSSAGRLPETKR